MTDCIRCKTKLSSDVFWSNEIKRVNRQPYYGVYKNCPLKKEPVQIEIGE